MKIRSVYDLKPAFQNLLGPLTKKIASRGITANQITILAAVLSMLEGLWLLSNPLNRFALLCLPLVLFIRMALNAIDGMLAREYGQKSKLGGVLNEVGDVVSDTCLYLPFAIHPAISSTLVGLFVLLAILTEFVGVTVASINGQRRYDGPMGKSDRAVFWGIVAFIAAVGVPLHPWVNGLLVLCLGLLLLTLYRRTTNGIR